MNNLNNHMDSSWLGFSLSNNSITLQSSSSDSSNLCLFEAFRTTTSSGNVVDVPREEDVATMAGATDLSILTVSPKLEDFLSGSCPTGTTAPPQQQELAQFSTGTTPLTVSTTTPEIYDSELKTIAASFLRCFATEQTDAKRQQQKVVPLVATEPMPKKSVDSFGQRTSIYRGVTRHRWTGRYEAHLWDNSCRREGQSRKGRQVYLGGYDKEEKAARAYDLAALKYWGPTTTTNFPVCNYEKELEEMKNMTRQEFVASLRRKSSGFSRGASIYRGVTRHHQHGRWQARIGRVAGNKDLYLGTFTTQEEAAEAYDIAAIKFRGLNAVTNFDMSRYDIKSIANSNLPVGGITGKSRNSSESASDGKSFDGSRSDDRDISSALSFAFASRPAASTLSFTLPINQDPSDYWSNICGNQNSCAPTINNTKNLNITPTLFHQSAAYGCTTTFQSPPSFHMDFSTNSLVNESNNGLFNVGHCVQQQQSGVSTSITTTATTTITATSSIPFTAPISLDSTSSSNYESSAVYGRWISPSLHSFQSAKPNISVIQTPIFGME